MQIFVKNYQKTFSISIRQIKKIVIEILKIERVCCQEVSIFFVSSKKISELHKLYFNDPSVTDCISFPLDPVHKNQSDILGDIFVCPEVAGTYVKNHGGEIYEEITLYVIHGLLHLLGYDDTSPQLKRSMRKAEKRHMKNLKEKNLLLTHPKDK